MAKKGKPAAILGHFVNYKPVLGRDVLTLVIEVPSVAAAEVFAALGYPTGGVSIPVAVARLEESASVAKASPNPFVEELAALAVGGCQEPQSAEVQRPDLTGVPPGPHPAAQASAEMQLKARHWSEMTPAQQTGVLRNEPDFWDFAGVHNAEEARDYIRAWCDVQSCAEIAPGTRTAAFWAQLQVRYGNWLRTKRGAA